MRLSLRRALHHFTPHHCLIWHARMCFKAFIKMYYALALPCQLAESHYNRFLLRRCAQGWRQSAKASQSDKRASADQLYQRLLLQRSLSCWKRVGFHKSTVTHT